MKIELKKLSSAHKSDLICLCNSIDRSFLSNRIPFPYTEASADWWLNMVAEHDSIDGIFRAIMVDQKLVGIVSVEQKNNVYCKDGEIGYYLQTNQWGKGIMTQAVEEICKTAFCQLDICRITGLVYAHNIASQKVLEKNGFLLDGRMKQAVWKNQQLHDLLIYEKLKQQQLLHP